MSCQEMSDNSLDKYHQEFFRWVGINEIEAFSLHSDSTERYFVSHKSLEEYFGDRYRTQRIIGAVCGHWLHVDFDDFLEKWICVFAILLYIGKERAIQIFLENNICDSQHPLEQKPSGFPLAPADEDFWPKYREYQWLFLPLEFKKGYFHQRIPSDRVLPIIEKEEIGRGGSAKIYAIKIHPDYDKLSLVDTSQHSHSASHRKYALKVYKSREAEELCESEIEGFAQTRSSDAIVSSYGSFKQESSAGPVFALILEHAEGGNFEDFLQKVSPPSTLGDMIAFWENLRRIALALHDIHIVHLPSLEKDRRGEMRNGWHQDVKPKNVLVFGDLAEGFEAKFKLADLGLSHFRKYKGDATDLDAETYGTTEYGAPEASRATDANDSKRIFVRQSTDVWSLGCVFSEALVWSIRGKDGLLKYRHLRKNETKRIHAHQTCGAFHDEIKVLSSVVDALQDLLSDLRKFDYITPRIVQLTEEMLAQQPDTRPTAKHVWYRTGIALQESSMKPHFNETDTSEGHDSNLLHVPRSPQRTATSPADLGPPGAPDVKVIHAPAVEHDPQSLPQIPSADQSGDSLSRRLASGIVGSPTELPIAIQNLNIPNGELRIDKSQSKLPEKEDIQVRRATTQPDSDELSQTKLPELSISEASDWAKKNRKHLPDDWPLRSLKDRDCVFLVEDGHEIKPHWNEVRDVVRSLAYAAKKFGKNGIDLYRMVGMEEIQSKTTTDLLSRLPLTSNLLSGDVDINRCLTKILGDYGDRLGSKRSGIFSISLLTRPLKPLIVYVLTTGEWDGNDDAKTPIATLIDRLNRTNCPQKHVGIQFIHFGTSEEGWKRLVELDDNLNLSRDIVDAERSTGNFWKMLIGSINDRFDANGEKIRKDRSSQE